MLVNFAPWYRNRMKLELSDSLQPVIEREQRLEIPVNWVTESEAMTRYMNRGYGNAYDFSQGTL